MITVPQRDGIVCFERTNMTTDIKRGNPVPSKYPLT